MSSLRSFAAKTYPLCFRPPSHRHRIALIPITAATVAISCRGMRVRMRFRRETSRKSYEPGVVMIGEAKKGNRSFGILFRKTLFDG